MPQQAEDQAPALVNQDALRFQVIATCLIALLFASLVFVLGGAVQRFIPVWQPIYMTLLTLLIVAESSFISYVVQRDRLILGENTRYLVAEIAVLFVLTRIVATLSTGAQSLQSDLQEWLISPLSILSDPPFIFCFMASLLIGFLAQQAVRDLHYLLPQSFERQTIPRDEHRYVYNMANQDRGQALQRINRRFVYGGGLLLVALMLQVVPGMDLSQSALAVSASVGFASLTYIISGFLLYSQSWLSMLQARWALESSKVDTQIMRRWSQISIILVAGLCIVALFVPRNYGMGLLDTLRSSLGIVGAVIAQIGYLLLWLGSLIIMLPMMLLAWLFPDSEAPEPPPPPPIPTPEMVTTLTEDLPPSLLPSLIFWACMFLLFGYAIWIVIQRHPGLKAWLTLQKPIYWLQKFFGIIWKDTSSWVQHAANSIATRLKQARPKETQQWPSLRLNRLVPRDLVRYFYRSILQRAAKHGLARQVGQTPYEYTQTLKAWLPDSQNDINVVTEAFVEAHYGPSDPDKDEIRKIKTHWERIRRKLTIFK